MPHSLHHRSTTTHIRALMLDWAGTMVDYGSRAPVTAFIAALARHQIQVTAAQARGPMGMAKRDHIAAILALPVIAQQVMQMHNRAPNDEDIDRIYHDFQTLQFECLLKCSQMIPGAAAAVAACREMGLKIASSTGYTRAMMDVVMPQAKAQGYEPDLMLCATDVEQGRPAPWMIFEAARRLNIYPPASIVTVDDTVVGVQAGRNAGTWSVGIALTGNEIGLTEEEVNALPADELSSKLSHARRRLYEAGAHLVIDSVAQLPEVVRDIDNRLKSGDKP